MSLPTEVSFHEAILPPPAPKKVLIRKLLKISSRVRRKLNFDAYLDTSSGEKRAKLMCCVKKPQICRCSTDNSELQDKINERNFQNQLGSCSYRIQLIREDKPCIIPNCCNSQENSKNSEVLIRYELKENIHECRSKCNCVQ